jgi:hypothetical protein
MPISVGLAFSLKGFTMATKAHREMMEAKRKAQEEERLAIEAQHKVNAAKAAAFDAQHSDKQCAMPLPLPRYRDQTTHVERIEHRVYFSPQRIAAMLEVKALEGAPEGCEVHTDFSERGACVTVTRRSERVE